MRHSTGCQLSASLLRSATYFSHFSSRAQLKPLEISHAGSEADACHLRSKTASRADPAIQFAPSRCPRRTRHLHGMESAPARRKRYSPARPPRSAPRHGSRLTTARLAHASCQLPWRRYFSHLAVRDLAPPNCLLQLVTSFGRQARHAGRLRQSAPARPSCECHCKRPARCLI